MLAKFAVKIGERTKVYVRVVPDVDTGLHAICKFVHAMQDLKRLGQLPTTKILGGWIEKG